MRLEEHPIDIYEHNYWLREYLPSFPMEQVIHIGTKLYTGSSTVKKMVERFFG